MSLACITNPKISPESMCVCVCVCVCVCIHIYIYTHTHTHARARALKRKYIYTQTRAHTHTHTYISISGLPTSIVSNISTAVLLYSTKTVLVLEGHVTFLLHYLRGVWKVQGITWNHNWSLEKKWYKFPLLATGIFLSLVTVKLG